jgi:hypothetical protein
MSAVIALKPSEPLSPARDAPRAAIRDLAAARGALDDAEDPCRAERDHAVRQQAVAREDDELTLGNWLAAPDGERPEFPSVPTSALAAQVEDLSGDVSAAERSLPTWLEQRRAATEAVTAAARRRDETLARASVDAICEVVTGERH